MNRVETLWRQYRGALWPLGVAYGGLMHLRAQAYEKGLLPRHRTRLPVVSVGNLRLGGSGKTPLVEWLARQLQKAGLRPGIVSRGYGRATAPESFVLVSDGQRVLATASQGGDEPVMLAHSLPGVPVAVCSKRLLACEYLATHQLADCVILDDGFQHLALARNVDVVIVDEGVLKEKVFPAGELREPVAALHRAHAFVIPAQADSEGILRCWLQEKFPSRSVFTMRRNLDAIIDFASGESVSMEKLLSVRLLAFAGIAAPARFFDALRSLGLSIVAKPLEDHANYSAQRLSEIVEQARRLGCDALITTAKDAVKIRENAAALNLALYVVRESLQVEPGEQLVGLILNRIRGDRNQP
jgi:tetraacyldisaccharide 4'-kinase